MSESFSADHALIHQFHASNRPVYVVGADRRIVYCNPAMAAWLDLTAERIVGRLVEYHSESNDKTDYLRDTAGPLAGLCPPPHVLQGVAGTGTVSSVARDGRLIYRRADFMPLDGGEPFSGSLLALLTIADLSPQELTVELSSEPTADELHLAIRRFRRTQTVLYSIESLLGGSPKMRKIRAQVTAAAASGANVLICGRRGTGRGHIARAIHYRAVGDSTVKLVPLDGQTISDESLRRALDSLSDGAKDATRRPTLLIESLECLTPTQQERLVEFQRRHTLAARIVATSCNADALKSAPEDDVDSHIHPIAPIVRDTLSTIAINTPRLVERLEDLPLLAQFFLESSNRGNTKQVGSLRPESLDLLALYSWPGEVDELRTVIAAAHRSTTSHAIAPADLPAVVHHAAQTAALPRRSPERIVLDDLLTTIEKEAIRRALIQAGGNKTEAAELLGLTRPRLYRRMEQLGLAPAAPAAPLPSFKELPLPDFRELDTEENSR